jgi:hypothetical protein
MMTFRMSCAWLGALVLFGGCAQPIDGVCDDGGAHEEDGGHAGHGEGDGGSADAGGGGMDGGGSGDGGADAGVSDAGADAGEHLRGDAGTFTWGTVPGMFVDEEVNAVHGTSGATPYIVTSKGRVRRWHDGDWQVAWFDTAASPRILRGLYVTPSGKVLAGGSNLLVHCTGEACTSQADFITTPMTGTLTGTVNGVCGRGESQIYAVGYSVTTGRVFRFDVAEDTWKLLVPDTGTGPLYGCWVASDGTLFVSSTNGRMVRVDTAGIAYVELVNSTAQVDANTNSFRAVHGAGGRVFATGTSRRIIERDPVSRTWNFVFVPTAVSSEMHHAMGGGAADEVFAGGAPATDRRLTRFDGAEWRFVKDAEGSITFSMTVMNIWAAGPDEIYLAGHKSWDGVVVRGTR